MHIGVGITIGIGIYGTWTIVGSVVAIICGATIGVATTIKGAYVGET